MGAEPEQRKALEDRLGWQFRDPSWLEQALTHPSFVQQHAHAGPHNQRLEFLGDAVLGLLLAEHLFRTLPGEREGVLTRNRAALANGSLQAELARRIGLQAHLRVSDAEEALQARERPSILADAVEAILGAAYLDGGLEAAGKVVSQLYGDLQAHLLTRLDNLNHKGRLQERLQALAQPTVPLYEIVTTSGPDHARVFEARVLVDGVERGRGKASSKKEAEELAARAALEFLDQASI